MASKRDAKTFQSSWCARYGIKISARDAQTGAIVSSKCLFCEKFGKDDCSGSRKRKRTANVQFFGRPWRTDNIEKHMKEQHSVKYTEYLKSSAEEKANFFQKNSVFLPLNSVHEGLNMLVDKKIVEKIIAHLLLDLDSDDDNLNSNHTALSIFQLQEEDDNNEDIDINSGRYLISISNQLQYQLIVKYIAAGLSFRQCYTVFMDTKETTNLGQIGSVNMAKVISYCRYTCAMAYQYIGDVLKSVWAFSIALDCGNKSRTSYLDVRVRFCIKEVLYNIHLVALPMFERHTGLNMFNIISEFFDGLNVDWKTKLIGISSDGSSNNTGSHSGVVTRLHQLCLPGCYRVWCAAHQMDLVVQKVFVKLINDTFVTKIMAITGHLRRQQNLITEMESKCPRFIDTRWLSMQKLLDWLVLKRPRLQRYFHEKNPTCSPDNSFWIIVYVLKAFLKSVNFCLTAIQGMTTLLNEQKIRLDTLISELIEDGYVEGPGLFESNDDYVLSGSYRVSLSNAEQFILDQDLFVVNLMQQLQETDEDFNMVRHSTALLFAESINGFSRIVAERNEMNQPTDNLPPVLPHDLLKLRPYEFAQLIALHQQRLIASFNEEEIIGINEEFKKMKDAYRREEGLKAVIDGFNHKTSFADGWKMLVDRYPLLCSFIAGLATVFPGTSTVESDFSVIGWEKDDYRTSLTDFSLEGVLHCKQFEILKGLSLSLNN